MRLREWDPSVANDAELNAWLAAYNACVETDLPGDPTWGPAKLAAYLTVTMPGERRVAWLIERTAGGGAPGQHVLGYARLLMLNGLGVLELMVPPWSRRQGLGRILLATVARRALSEGFNALGVEVAGGTAGDVFATTVGFRHAYTEMRSILDLSTVDWSRAEENAAAVATGYEIQYYPGDLPDEILPAYAEAKQVRRHDPTGELELRPSSYDAERLRASLRCLQARGLKPYIAVAVHERSGRVAGLTELVVPAQHPTRADQYDTTIVPAHNSYGLGRALKARMLVELRAAEPQLRDVQTWHAMENRTLQHLNDELGFKPDRQWHEFDTDATELVSLLRDVPDLPS